MKRILFVIPGFEIGGTNTSLINLLSHIDKNIYVSFVYAINNYGQLRDDIAKNARIINSEVNSGDNRGDSLSKKLFRLVRSLGIDLFPIYCKRVARAFKKDNYDAIIAFQEGRATQLVSYCSYTKTIAWVRSEYGRYLKVNNTKPEVTVYGKFTYIVNVSETAKKNFLSFLPQYSDKTKAIYNFEDLDRIFEKSNESINLPGEDAFTIVSIGRTDPVKHFSEIPEICKVLVEKGKQFRWLIVGGKTESNPEEYDNISKMIVKRGLEKVVYQMGHQRNPYAILKQCNMLVCLSESETFNHTFVEARLLHVPVISVNYESAKEFLKKEEGGLIVERSKMVDMLLRYLEDTALYDELRNNTYNFSFDNKKIMDEVEEILG